MSSLAQARCYQHVSREAVARCPDCERFYCRECVTEHDGRMICRSCLKLLLESENQQKVGWFSTVGGSVFAIIGFIFGVGVFYLIGRLLLRIPSNFHNGIFF